MTTPRIPRHVKTLDSMRAISALIVFASHLLQIFWFPLIGLYNAVHTANSLLSETAVIIFFLLSGYLITMSIWKNIGKSGYFMISEFSAARLARIYPPLLCAILIVLIVFFLIKFTGLPGVSTPLRHPSDLYAARDLLTVSRGEVVSALLMRGGLLQVNGPLWSLYIEVQLYAAAGAAALALKGRVGLWRVAGAAVFAAFCWFIYRHGYLLYAAWWLVGSAFFLCQLYARRDLVLTFACGVLGAAILYFNTAGLAVEAARLCLMLPFSYLMFFVWNWESARLENVAGFSYTLYLIHFPLMVLCYSAFLALQTSAPPALPGRILASLFAASIAYLVAWALGRRVENTRPFKQLILSSFQYGRRRLKTG
jgi:peptidoglycan/LPS O-acetylase OafA/YrhL